MKVRNILIGSVCMGCLVAQQGQAQNKTTYPLINSRIETVQGTFEPGHTVDAPAASANTGLDGAEPSPQTLDVPDTCQFELSLDPGETAIEARQVSDVRITDSGCEADMEIGTPPDDQLEPPDAAPHPGTSSGYVNGYFTDPPGIWVNSEQVNLSWNWFGLSSCAFIYSLYERVPTYFFGWGKDFGYLFPQWTCLPYFPGYPIFSSRVGGIEYAGWSNGIFPGCAGGIARTYYLPLSVSGDNQGRLYGNFAWTITGPGPLCINLLRANFQLIRTYN
jgi:hypothetical protein